MAKPLDVELKTLQKHQEELEREHAGKFVLIHGNEVIGTYDEFETAADEGLRLFGESPFLIRQLAQPPVTIPDSVLLGLTVANP